MSVAYSMEPEDLKPIPLSCKALGFSTDPETQAALRTAFSLLGHSDPSGEENGLREVPLHEAIHALPEGLDAELLIIDIDDCMDIAATLNELVSNAGERARIIAIGSENDVHLYRDLIAVGIEDYLVKPVSPDLLIAASQAPRKQKSSSEPEQEEETPNVTLVIGARGGIGASTLAINLAWWLAHERKLKTSLLDLDLHFGISALAFDLEAATGLNEALASPDRLDSLLMESAIIQESPNLKLLGAEDDLTLKSKINTQALSCLFEELRLISGQIVVDMPRHMLTSHSDVLKNVDHVFLLTDQTLSALRDTVRIQRFLKSVAPRANVHLVLSDGVSNSPEQFPEEQFAQSVGQDIEYRFTAVPDAATQAANLGQPIVSLKGQNPIGETIADMCTALCGEEEEPQEEASLLSRLKGLLGR